MYLPFFYILFLAIITPTWARLKSPPDSDPLPEDSTPPTVWNPDGTPYEPNATSPSKKKPHKSKGKSPADKHFHESTFDAHYDGRFADKMYPPDERNKHLRALLRTYLATMHSLRAETWIMHGSLLGWWWNGRIMPWDSDIDVQVSEAALSYLASHHNMSVYSFQHVAWLGDVNMPGQELAAVKGDDTAVKANRGRGEEGKRSYLLEVNPHWQNGSYADLHNVIDARWIDMKTGLYIDITTVRLNTSAPVPGTLYCKDRHHYLTRQIFPLRISTFEGVPAKVPYAYQELLAEEYGSGSLVDRVYKKAWHWFDAGKMEWVKMNRGDESGVGGFSQYEEQREKARKKDRKRPSARGKSQGNRRSSGKLKSKQRS